MPPPITLPGCPPVLYLDMNVWVRLAQGVAGKSEAWRKRFARLEDATRSGKVKIPLTSALYMELWNRGHEASRTDVARIMAALTGYTTLGALHVVTELEIRAEIHRRLTGISSPVERDDVIGLGVNHAFASEHGRLRFVASVETESSAETPTMEQPDGWQEFQGSGQNWEWIHLAGVQTLMDAEGFDRTPEHRLGTAFVREEEELRRRFSEDAEMWNHRSGIIITQEFIRVLEIINDTAEERNINPRTIFQISGSVQERRKDTKDFIRSIPTVWTIAKLREWKHQNRNLAWHQHDRGDFISLALALPYCDIVVTENLWSHLANASKLARDFGTRVYPPSKIDQVLDELEA